MKNNIWLHFLFGVQYMCYVIVFCHTFFPIETNITLYLFQREKYYNTYS